MDHKIIVIVWQTGEKIKVTDGPQDNSNCMTNGRENKGYQWTSESKLKIIEALSEENGKNKIINFEIKNFAEDQYGI